MFTLGYMYPLVSGHKLLVWDTCIWLHVSWCKRSLSLSNHHLAVVQTNQPYNAQDKHKKPKQLNLTKPNLPSLVDQETNRVYSNKKPQLPEPARGHSTQLKQSIRSNSNKKIGISYANIYTRHIYEWCFY